MKALVLCCLLAVSAMAQNADFTKGIVTVNDAVLNNSPVSLQQAKSLLGSFGVTNVNVTWLYLQNPFPIASGSTGTITPSMQYFAGYGLTLSGTMFNVNTNTLKTVFADLNVTNSSVAVNFGTITTRFLYQWDDGAAVSQLNSYFSVVDGQYMLFYIPGDVNLTTNKVWTSQNFSTNSLGGVTTNFTPQGSTSVFYITNGIVKGVQ